MSNQLAELVDPLRLADTGQALKGQVAVARMPRLVSMLGVAAPDSGSPDVTVDLKCGVDGQGVRYMRGSLRADALGAVCQRCLQPMTLPLRVDTALGMARTLDDAENLPGDYEPLMVAEGETQSLAVIIEDELLLALPSVPMHPVGACAAAGILSGVDAAEDVPAEGKKRPFAGLAAAFGAPASRGADTSTDTSRVTQLQQLKKKP
jgi:uncharacterized protein